MRQRRFWKALRNEGFPRPDPPGPVRTPQCRLRPAERAARRRPPPPQIRGADTASLMAFGGEPDAGQSQLGRLLVLQAADALAVLVEERDPAAGAGQGVVPATR